MDYCHIKRVRVFDVRVTELGAFNVDTSDQSHDLVDAVDFFRDSLANYPSVREITSAYVNQRSPEDGDLSPVRVAGVIVGYLQFTGIPVFPAVEPDEQVASFLLIEDGEVKIGGLTRRELEELLA